ncbi:hypothetical protein V8D89_011176 [Ganoderma adspersum]
MSVVSKLTFIHFIPRYTDSDAAPQTYHSDRDSFRGELRGGLNTRFAAGIAGMGLPYSKEKFIPAPPDIRQRALQDPEGVLPHVMAAAKLLPLPLAIPVLKFSQSRFRDLTSSHGSPASTRAHLPVPDAAEELVLDPDSLEPILTAPLSPSSLGQPRERRQRRDVNKARHRPVSNPDGKPMRARKVGALTSNFVLDQPARPTTAAHKVLKPLSELRLPVIVSDRLGGYVAPGRDDGEADEIESFSDSEDESERRNWAKRRRYS